MGTTTKLIGIACLAGVLLGGCQTPPAGEGAGNGGQAASEAGAADGRDGAKQKDPTTLKEEALAQAIDVYTDGRYDEAIAALAPLSTAPELPVASQIKAYKFIAFSHCASGRQRQCRQTFESALQLDPNFQLSDVEKGHPVWGKEFLAARAAAAAAAARSKRAAPARKTP